MQTTCCAQTIQPEVRLCLLPATLQNRESPAKVSVKSVRAYPATGTLSRYVSLRPPRLQAPIES